MKIATLEKANKIQSEIERLKNEIDWLYSYNAVGWFERVIFGIKKTAFLHNKNKYHHEEYFDLEKEDVEILTNRRILKIRELCEEMENLQDNKEESEDA